MVGPLQSHKARTIKPMKPCSREGHDGPPEQPAVWQTSCGLDLLLRRDRMRLSALPSSISTRLAWIGPESPERRSPWCGVRDARSCSLLHRGLD